MNSADYAKQATITFDEWCKRLQGGVGNAGPAGTPVPYSYKNTAWYKAGKALEAETHPAPTPAPSPATGSVFAGKGAFCTSEPAAVSGHPMDWVALQADPEGNTTPPATSARIMWWMARPTQAKADEAMRRGIPFIGQAENTDEINRLLALDVTGPKAIVGNAGSWAAHDRTLAAERGWDLIQEWYKNAHPWELSPDAANYPRFVNVCFGIYGEGEPGGQGYVQQIPLADYRQVWHGSFSVWKAEAMTPADWAVFQA